MATYAEKLKDPRWQKKRLEILQRDNWKCQTCSDTKTTLNVHHLKYNGEPWDSNSKDLITTCEDCHTLIEAVKVEGSGSQVEKVIKRKQTVTNKLYYFVKFKDREAVYIITVMPGHVVMDTCIGLSEGAIKELCSLINI